ncbi:MAG TPA: RDD family protein [Terriglobales bacterium]
MSGPPVPGMQQSSFCTRCGKPVLAGSPFCTNCGAQQPLPPPVAAYALRVEYAGFWLRFVAYVIDQLILGIAITPFMFGVIGGAAMMRGDPGDIGLMMHHVVRLAVISLVIKWLYFALMESSSKQATLGKMVLGLRVTDMNLQRIEFGRASGRFFGKILSGMLLMIGYIMAAFTERKQALHDMLAGTLVIRS